MKLPKTRTLTGTHRDYSDEILLKTYIDNGNDWRVVGATLGISESGLKQKFRRLQRKIKGDCLPKGCPYSADELRNILQKYQNQKATAARDLGHNARTFQEWALCLERPQGIDDLKDAIIEDPVAPPTGFDINSLRSYKRFVISSALNNCPIHTDFVEAIQNYCERNNAFFIVQPLKYRNPNAILSGEDVRTHWPTELNNHYLSEQVRLNDNLYILGDLRIQATSINPISALNTTVPVNASSVVGHPIIQLAMKSAPFDTFPRYVATTGSVSMKGFTTARSAYMANKYHAVAAMIVEVDGDRFYTRHIYADKNGSFYDLDTQYHASGKVTNNIRVEGLVCGDIHARWLDESVKKCTFTDTDSLAKVVKPKQVVIHDFFDSDSISHHHRDHKFIQYEKHQTDRQRVADELGSAVDLHNELLTVKDTRYIYVPSNHNDHLYRWLDTYQPEAYNLKAYCELTLMVLDQIDSGKPYKKEPFFLWLKKRVKNPESVKFLTRGESYSVAGVDVSLHGDKGPNGSRGSIKSYAGMDRKMVIGHSHTPAIERLVTQVGTSCKLQMDYLEGPSSWMHAHSLIYPNGATCLIFIVKGKWRL